MDRLVVGSGSAHEERLCRRLADGVVDCLAGVADLVGLAGVVDADSLTGVTGLGSLASVSVLDFFELDADSLPGVVCLPGVAEEPDAAFFAGVTGELESDFLAGVSALVCLPGVGAACLPGVVDFDELDAACLPGVGGACLAAGFSHMSAKIRAKAA